MLGLSTIGEIRGLVYWRFSANKAPSVIDYVGISCNQSMLLLVWLTDLGRILRYVNFLIRREVRAVIRRYRVSKFWIVKNINAYNVLSVEYSF